MITLFLIILYLLGCLVATKMTFRMAKVDEPLISKADLNFALWLCTLSWVWVIILKLEK